MTDTLPATRVEQEVMQSFDAGSPLQRMFGETLRRVGGMDFLQEWAEDNPSDFVRILVAVNPSAVQQPSGGNQVNVNIHPSLTPGPLDVTPVND